MQSYGKGGYQQQQGGWTGKGGYQQQQQQGGYQQQQGGWNGPSSQGQGHPMAGHGPATGSHPGITYIAAQKQGLKGGLTAQRPTVAPQKGAPPAQKGGPPRREMDSLLEEMKAKQQMQDQAKENLKKAAVNPAVVGAAMGAGARGFPSAPFPQQGQFNQGGGGGFNQGGGGGSGFNQGGGSGMGCGGKGGGGGFNQGGGGLGGGGSYSQGNQQAPGNFNNASAGNFHQKSVMPAEDLPIKVPPRAAGPEYERSLYCKELPRSINEETLCQLFSRYGSVVGVSIMHARDDKEETCGYVTMDRRDNASKAKEALHDRDVDGVPMWIEWTKGPTPQVPDDAMEGPGSNKDGCKHMTIEVPADQRKRRIIDQMAKYVSQEGHQFEMVIMEREPADGNHEDFSFLFQHDSPDNRYYRWRLFAFAQGDNFKIWRTQSFRLNDGGAWWRPPPCEVSREIVAKKKMERSNFSTGPSGFGSAGPAPELAAGSSKEEKDGDKAANTKTPSRGEIEPVAPPAVDPNSCIPSSKVPAGWTQADITEERERCRLEERATQERQKRDRDKRGIAGGKRLSDGEWDRMETLLRNLAVNRAPILETMVFCLDKSDSAIEICEGITESLTILETEMSVKLARLLVVSDILHNTTSSKPAAWAYRREFEKSLPDILEHLHLSLMRVESRIMIEKFRNAILKVLLVWEDWGLFAPQYTRGLQAALVIGVKNLRFLRSKGDLSREPAWIELKLNEWRRQHFSQLEKMCRTRGLRSSTAHLEATRECSLEESRKEWLVDRLVCYEIHWHEKEQAIASASKSKQISADDLDGEAIECDIDGFPLEEGALDGHGVDLSELGAVMYYMQASTVLPQPNLGGIVPGPPSDEEESDDGVRTPDSLGQDASPLASSPGDKSALSDDDRMDSDKPEDTSDIPAMDAGAGAASQADLEERRANLDRDIDLEVMELRASLVLQGLHTDAIQDICDEKRQRMIDEFEASFTSPMNAKDSEKTLSKTKGGGRTAEGDSASNSSPSRGRDREKKKEPKREKEQEKEREREKDRERKEKGKDKKEKEKAKEKDRAKKRVSRSPSKEPSVEPEPSKKSKKKEKTKEKEKDKEKDKARSRSKDKVKKRVSRSASREQTKKKARR